MNIFEQNGYDGTGREPRQQQLDALEWLHENWYSSDVLALTCPTGSGKSLISRSIQRRFKRTRYLVYSNVLVNQYVSEYGEVTPYYGIQNYDTKEEYLTARAVAADPENPIASNPIALYFLKDSHPEFTDADVVILDEADASLGLMANLAVKKFPICKRDWFRRGGLNSPENLAAFFQERVDKWKEELAVKQKSKRVMFKTIAALETKIHKLFVVAEALRREPHRMAIYLEEPKDGRHGYASVKPIRFPTFILREVFGNAKIVLLSATIFHSDIVDCLPKSTIRRIELTSPIPVEQRRIRYSPITVDSWYPVPYDEIAAKVDRILDKHPEARPALIHATYGDAAEIAKRLKNKVLTYDTKEDKLDVVEKWMNEGGILIGPGLTTGLDLKHELCRLNIVTKVPFPNIMDPFVAKKKAEMPMWYPLQAAKQVIQACGRSTRSPDDWSIGYIIDGRWSGLMARMQKYLPRSFTEAVDKFVTEV